MKAVILEDEHLIAKELQAKIKTVAPFVQVIEVLTSLKAAKKWLLHNQEPTVWIMDIQLSDGISFELFEIYQLRAPVIFTTAYDEFALKAFKSNGIDYLLKPIDEVELLRALEKIKKATLPLSNDIDWANIFANYSAPKTSFKERIIVQVRNNWMPINTKDIACIYKEALIYLYLFNGEKFPYEAHSLDEIEELLDSRYFYRANRQTIVNLSAIKMVQQLDSQKLLLMLNISMKQNIEISREKMPLFKKWFNQ